ncbi:hypothetical protein HMPREF3174_05880 [Trueperella sp. HMSC08H06]|nr:hypothetical protein HMPREF3174_05880 [Trueperella sp. HMSC08H06]
MLTVKVVDMLLDIGTCIHDLGKILWMEILAERPIQTEARGSFENRRIRSSSSDVLQKFSGPLIKDIIINR